jgi:hypothetical protein
MKVVCSDGELHINMEDFCQMDSDWIQCVQTKQSIGDVKDLVSEARVKAISANTASATDEPYCGDS